MEAFEMHTDELARSGAQVGSLAARVTGVTAAGAVNAAALTPIFGIVGGDYVANFLRAIATADTEMVRLATFYGSAATGIAESVAASVTTDAGGAASLLGAASGLPL